MNWNDLDEWLWPVIAVLWLVFKVLPRLFRGRPASTEVPTGEPRPARRTFGERKREELQGNTGPPPIEPR
jgi:hypothetical protein